MNYNLMRSHIVHRAVASLAALVAAGASLAGCANTGEPDPAEHWRLVGNETFRPEASGRAVDRIMLAQTVTAAGEDAMLYNHHFDGAELNSLGQSKLRLMLEDLGFLADPHVYVVSGNSEQLAAVRRYLADWGLALEDDRLHVGANPMTRRSAALGLAQMQKFEDTEMRASEDGESESE